MEKVNSELTKALKSQGQTIAEKDILILNLADRNTLQEGKIIAHQEKIASHQ